ncbi:MAG TPA: Hsp20/alpha crystallin family protein [Chroococcales cyanobacterium]
MFIPFYTQTNGFRTENPDFRSFGDFRSSGYQTTQPYWADLRPYDYSFNRTMGRDYNYVPTGEGYGESRPRGFSAQPYWTDYSFRPTMGRDYNYAPTGEGYGEFRPRGYSAQSYGTDFRPYGYSFNRTMGRDYSFAPTGEGYGEFRGGDFTYRRNEMPSYSSPAYEQGWGGEGGFEGFRSPYYGDFRPYNYYGNYQPMGMGRESQGEYGPLANFAETPDANLMVVELPGIDCKDLNLQVSGNTLILTAVRHPFWQNGGSAFYYHTTEGRFGTMRRYFQLPYGISPAQIQASFINGILTVMLPKPSMGQGGGTHQGMPVSNVMINNG